MRFLFLKKKFCSLINPFPDSVQFLLVHFLAVLQAYDAPWILTNQRGRCISAKNSRWLSRHLRKGGLGSPQGGNLISVLSLRLWQWAFWAAASEVPASGSPAAGRSTSYTLAQDRTAADQGWAASGDSSLYRTHFHSSCKDRNIVIIDILFLPFCSFYEMLPLL